MNEVRKLGFVLSHAQMLLSRRHWHSCFRFESTEMTARSSSILKQMDNLLVYGAASIELQC